MKTRTIISRQRGVALILSLLLLMVMTIVGIATMSSTNMQQRMAGNAYLQAQAFEAASAGVANALDFRDAFWPGGATCNASTGEEWFGTWQTVGNIGGAQLRQRMYCLPFENDEGVIGGYELFVLNRGEVLNGEQVVAQREIEVRVGRFGTPAGPVCQSVAMCFPINPNLDLGDCDPSDTDFCDCIDDINPFSGFNSNAFSVYGHEYDDFGHGPALALPPNHMLAFECTVTGGQTAEQCEAGNMQGQCSRLGNYVDSIVATEDFGEPWNDPLMAFEFAQALRNEVLDSATHIRPGHSDWSNFNVPQSGSWSGANFSGNTNLGQGSVTYIDGDALLGGGVTGSGIIVIEGRMRWNGTPEFDGLIIALGGYFDVGGGGQGGDGAGSLVVVDMDPVPSETQPYTCQEGDGFDCEPLEEILLACADNPDCTPGWGDTFHIHLRGGGTAQYAFGCEELWESWSNLGPADWPGNMANPSELQELWMPNCDPDAAEPPIGVVEGLASWRENIGWRQEVFPGSQD